MFQVNVFQAKTEFSKLLALLEKGEEEEIVIARNGVPTAKLTLWKPADQALRIGAVKGLFTVPDDFDADDRAIAQSFEGGPW